MMSTGDSRFSLSNRSEKDIPFATRLLSDVVDPSGIPLEMDREFGGQLWFDGFKCYENGKSLRPIAISLGTANLDGEWQARATFHTTWQRQPIGNDKMEFRRKRFPTSSRPVETFQYERDLAQLFVTLIVGEIGKMNLDDAMMLVRREAKKRPFLDFLRDMNEQQMNAAISFATDVVKGWNRGKWYGRDEDSEKDMVNTLHRRCLDGVSTALTTWGTAWQRQACYAEEFSQSWV
jgi:hypothetical protein